MKRIILSLCAILLTVGFSAGAMAAEPRAKISSIDIVVDDSGSMMMHHAAQPKKIKMKMAQEELAAFSKRISDSVRYDVGMHTIAPVMEVLPFSPFNRAKLDAAIAGLKSDKDIFGRLSPLGDGLVALGPKYTNLPRQLAIVLVSDGASNSGIGAYEGAKMLFDSQPGICFHVLSVADSPEGQEALNKIAALNPCNLADLGIAQAMAPAKASPSDAAQTIVLRSIQFRFGSSALEGNYATILDELANILNQRPASRVRLEGNTCTIGPYDYNVLLSKQRAESVKKYLVSKGIAADRIDTIGNGPDKPKYDNKTAEGRSLNRRTEIFMLN